MRTLALLQSLLISCATVLAQSAVSYICPMYCTGEVSTTPGICSVCKMDLEDKEIVEHPSDYELISSEETAKMMGDSSFYLLDVRTIGEFTGSDGHIALATLIPIKELERRMDELSSYKDKTIITYCSHGIRSATAAKLLTRHGYKAKSMKGGLMTWNRAGLPLVFETK